MGVRTQWVDALTFGLGSGIAGVAGVALSQSTNVGPNLGQQYIVDSFMVVVFGGVGQSVGHADRRHVARRGQQVARAVRRRGAGQDLRAGRADPVHPAAAAGAVPAEGPRGGEVWPAMQTRTPCCSLLTGDRGTAVFLVIVAMLGASSCRCCTSLPAEARRCTCQLHDDAGRQVHDATRCWRWRWTWCGATAASCRSGHGAFFALGGYAMGMYLMRQIGRAACTADPMLPDFMVFLNWKELPWYWHGFDMFWFAMLMVVAGAGTAGVRVRLVRVPLARHRRLLLDHHAGAHLRADARVLPQRHGLRRQQRLHGLQGDPRLSDQRRRHARGAVRAHAPLRCCSATLACRYIVTSRAGRVVHGDPRRRKPHAFIGYRVESYKLWIVRRSPRCWPASPVRCTCRRSASSTRASSSPINSIEMVDLGGGRRARHVVRRGRRRGRW